MPKNALETDSRFESSGSLTTDATVKSKSSYPEFQRLYPSDFEVTKSYRDTLPDLQNGPSSLIRGTQKEIQHVGLSTFRMPLNFEKRDGSMVTLDTSVTGTVSLEAGKKGINMSRIMRSFYDSSQTRSGFEALKHALESYKKNLECFDARINLRFDLPLLVESLRSGLAGYQFYTINLELVECEGRIRQVMHIDYVYSSTCPCSLELSEHSREVRNQLATPHSQRSVARVSLLVNDEAEKLWVEDVIDALRRAVPTETQVIVKREDEQAFAELNAANPIFVEDAVRLFAEQAIVDERISDYRIVASHQESLHSHDAVSVLIGDNGYFSAEIEPHLFSSMFHVG